MNKGNIITRWENARFKIIINNNTTNQYNDEDISAEKNSESDKYININNIIIKI
jgi:hypothetical protein